MMWSPLSSGLVAGVISESGARGPRDPATGSVATSYNTKEEAESYGVTFLSLMNVSSIAELRQVSMADLIEQGQLTESDYYDGTPFSSLYSGPPRWRPNIDGYVFRHGYGESLALNAHADVPILTGNNKNENDIRGVCRRCPSTRASGLRSSRTTLPSSSPFTRPLQSKQPGPPGHRPSEPGSGPLSGRPAARRAMPTPASSPKRPPRTSLWASITALSSGIRSTTSHIQTTPP